MSTEGTLAALSQRIESTYEIGDRLSEVLSDFLESHAGQSFEWKSSQVPNAFGHVQGVLRTRQSSHQTEKSSILLNLKPSGLVTIGISDWTLNDVGDWEEETETVQEKFEPAQSSEESAAQVLSAIMASSSKFGVSLRLFLESQLSGRPSASLQPEPE